MALGFSPVQVGVLDFDLIIGYDLFLFLDLVFIVLVHFQSLYLLMVQVKGSSLQLFLGAFDEVLESLGDLGVVYVFPVVSTSLGPCQAGVEAEFLLEMQALAGPLLGRHWDGVQVGLQFLL